MSEQSELSINLTNVKTYEGAQDERQKAISYLVEQYNMPHYEAVSLVYDIYDLGFNRAGTIWQDKAED